METKVQRHRDTIVCSGGGILCRFYIKVRYFFFDSQLSLTSAMSKVKSFVAYSHKHMTLFVWALTIIISVHCWHAHVIVLVSTLPTYIMHSLNRNLYVLVQCYWCQAGFYTTGIPPSKPKSYMKPCPATKEDLTFSPLRIHDTWPTNLPSSVFIMS